MPLADLILLGHPKIARAVQNIGGIANVTYLPPARLEQSRKLTLRDRLAVPDRCVDGVMAFDTGPGNMIIDRAVQLITNGRMAFDKNGAMAAGGAVDRAAVEKLMRHPYFRRRPPKTTGRELFGREFTDGLVAQLPLCQPGSGRYRRDGHRADRSLNRRRLPTFSASRRGRGDRLRRRRKSDPDVDA